MDVKTQKRKKGQVIKRKSCLEEKTRERKTAGMVRFATEFTQERKGISWRGLWTLQWGEENLNFKFCSIF